MEKIVIYGILLSGMIWAYEADSAQEGQINQVDQHANQRDVNKLFYEDRSIIDGVITLYRLQLAIGLEEVLRKEYDSLSSLLHGKTKKLLVKTRESYIYPIIQGLFGTLKKTMQTQFTDAELVSNYVPLASYYLLAPLFNSVVEEIHNSGLRASTPAYETLTTFGRRKQNLPTEAEIDLFVQTDQYKKANNWFKNYWELSEELFDSDHNNVEKLYQIKKQGYEKHAATIMPSLEPLKPLVAFTTIQSHLQIALDYITFLRVMQQENKAIKASGDKLNHVYKKMIDTTLNHLNLATKGLKSYRNMPAEMKNQLSARLNGLQEVLQETCASANTEQFIREYYASKTKQVSASTSKKSILNRKK